MTSAAAALSPVYLPRAAAHALKEGLLPDLIAFDMMTQVLRRKLKDPDAEALLEQMSNALVPHIEGIRLSLDA